MLAVTDRVKALHEHTAVFLEIKRSTGAGCGDAFKQPARCCRQFRLRFPAALTGYFRDAWNYIDIVNYSLFICSMAVRFRAMALVPEVRAKVQALGSARDPYAEYVDFSVLGFYDRLQYDINAGACACACACGRAAARSAISAPPSPARHCSPPP